ncbi:MAG: hypothetical protein RBU21_11920 [FCB group bacterium]|nr:hypothetical protein [FCB group bacterium]
MKHSAAATVIISLSVFVFLCAAQAEQPKRLNNLVTELARESGIALNPDATVRFTHPREGWVHVRIETDAAEGATLEVSTAAGDVLASHAHPEGMRFLPAGECVLKIHGNGVSSLRSIVVRAVPELQFTGIQTAPFMEGHGPYDWAFLEANILPNVNTVVGPAEDEHIDAWTARGGKWVVGTGLPTKPDRPVTPEEAFQHWASNAGIADPRLTGIMVDEFHGRQNANYPAWIEAVRRLGDTEAFSRQHKIFYAYCGGPGLYSRPQSRDLVRSVLGIGSYMAWERYLHEMPTHEEARAFLDAQLGGEMRRWQETFPDIERRLVMVAPIFTLGLSMNLQPEVDYKAWLDMQIQYYATDPAFDGLFGLQYWTATYADEELLRWAYRLFRHYGIEGNTALLSDQYGYTYALDHISNPDFADGLAGWTVEPAAEGSVGTGYIERLANLEGRYWLRQGTPDEPAGNTFLLLTRNGGKPNRVSQEIRNLKPGNLYSAKLISADYGDISAEISEEKRLDVSIAVEGADPIPEKCYQSAIDSRMSVATADLFDGGKLAWFNHHRAVFRATAPTAKLVISDGSLDQPATRQVLCNFVEVQPYFEN